MPTIAFHNLGCKVNGYETDYLIEVMSDAGYEIVSFEDFADVYVVNTCSVTNMADRKSRQMLHRGKKHNPDAVVVGLGCYVQMWQEQTSEDTGIDLVIGNNRKKELPQILEQYLAIPKEERKQMVVMEGETNWSYEDTEITRVSEHTRAYVKIQDGCNQFCSYCIIPYARGRIRSRALEDLEKEIHALAANGYKEVVLTGIHLSSYGKDWKDRNVTLLDAIRRVHQVEGIERIRLGSLEPGIITDDFAKALSELTKVCPHFHLSLQSGCDTVLKRMNRRYNTEEYYDKCEILRKYFENPAFTTDIIAGFPGETKEEHEATKEFLAKVGFSEMHVFKYSMRKGTKAASMKDQVPEQIKTERSNELIALEESLRYSYQACHLGKRMPLLLEETIDVNGKTYWIGHTPNYLKVAIEPTSDMCSNQIYDIVLTKIDDNHMIFGEIQ